MSEIHFPVESIDPLSLYGVNDHKLGIIQKYFPKLKLIPRGTVLKAVGEDDELKVFAERLAGIMAYLTKYNTISDSDLENVVAYGYDPAEEKFAEAASDEALVFGVGGKVIKARTDNQRKLVQAVNTHDMVFALGPAGTGKTYTAVALAVRALKNKEVKRLILTRPAVEAGENLGFLPGDLKEKLDPYLQPIYDALHDMLPPDKLSNYLEGGVIQIAPLAFMRGRTLDNAFVILDEAQNATRSQMKMFLTRMGKTAKFVVTGDVTQIDLPRNQPSGLTQAIHLLRGVPGIAHIQLNAGDVIRHKLVRLIIEAYDKEKEQGN